MSMLRHFRTKAGMTQADLAERAGTSQPQIKRLETSGPAGRKLTKEWAERLAPHLGVEPEHLLFGGSTVPIAGFVGAGGEAHFMSFGHDEVDEAPRPPGSGPETTALIVKGGSMPGYAEDNWLVYYDDRRDGMASDLLGELCVVGLTSGRVLVKKVYPGTIAGRYNLISTAYEDILNAEIEWAAKVDWIKPR
jgi:transcriptional regulator with XRE-family HTH domain